VLAEPGDHISNQTVLYQPLRSLRLKFAELGGRNRLPGARLRLSSVSEVPLWCRAAWTTRDLSHPLRSSAQASKLATLFSGGEMQSPAFWWPNGSALKVSRDRATYCEGNKHNNTSARTQNSRERHMVPPLSQSAEDRAGVVEGVVAPSLNQSSPMRTPDCESVPSPRFK